MTTAVTSYHAYTEYVYTLLRAHKTDCPNFRHLEARVENKTTERMYKTAVGCVKFEFDARVGRRALFLDRVQKK